MSYFRFILAGILFFASLNAQDAIVPPPEELPIFAESENGHFFFEFMRMMALLGLVLAVLLTILWFFKRAVNSRMVQLNESSLVKVVERRPLTQKSILYVIEFEGKKVLIADSHSGITFLCTDEHKGPSFAKVLEDKLRG